MKKNNHLKSFIVNYEGNFAIFIAALFIATYPIVYFFVSFAKLSTFLDWNLYLLFFLPLFCICWYLLWILFKPQNKIKQPLKNSLNTFNSHKELIFFVLFMLWALISTIVSGNFLKTFFGIISHASLEGYIMFLFYAFCFYLGFKIKNDKYKNILIITFFFTSIFVSLITFFDMDNYIFKAFLLNNTHKASMFVNSNHFGYFLVISIMLAAGLFLTQNKKWIRYTALAAFFLHCAQLSINDTLGCHLAIICALMVVFIVMSIKDKKISWLTLILIFIYVITSIFWGEELFVQLKVLFKHDIHAIITEPTSDRAKLAGTNRWKLWLEAFYAIKEKPIFGNANIINKPHNELLQYAQAWGLPSLIFYTTACAFLFVKAFKNLKNLSSISLICAFVVGGYLISSFFGNTVPHVMPFFCLFLGLFSRSLPSTKSNFTQKQLTTHVKKSKDKV